MSLPDLLSSPLTLYEHGLAAMNAEAEASAQKRLMENQQRKQQQRKPPHKG